MVSTKTHIGDMKFYAEVEKNMDIDEKCRE
jgi:hypothetical protein